MSTQEATVEVLHAEVRVLMVGKRQVTLSVFRQLDSVPPEEIEPFGRVRDPKEGNYVQVVGRRAGSSELVASYVYEGGASVEYLDNEYRRAMNELAESQRVAYRTREVGIGVESAQRAVALKKKRADEALETFGRACDNKQQIHEWNKLPLIVLAGLT